MKKFSQIIHQSNGTFVSDDHSHYRPWWVNGIRVEDRLYTDESAYHIIEFWQTSYLGVMLVLNGCIQMCGEDEYTYHEMVVHLPMQAHTGPVKNVLVVGDGDGGSVKQLTRYNQIEHIDWVDIDAKVVELCEKYYPELAVDDYRVTYFESDIKDFIGLYPDNKYDVIIWGLDDSVLGGNHYDICARLLAEKGIAAANMSEPWPDPHNFIAQKSAIDKVFSYTSLARDRFPSWANTGEIMLMSQHDHNFKIVHNIELPVGLKWYNRAFHFASQVHPTGYSVDNAWIPYT